MSGIELWPPSDRISAADQRPQILLIAFHGDSQRPTTRRYLVDDLDDAQMIAARWSTDHPQGVQMEYSTLQVNSDGARRIIHHHLTRDGSVR